MKRGNLLWTSSRMMLAEHRQLLNERIHEKDGEYNVIRLFDEQQKDEWQNIISEAIINEFEIVIKLDNKSLKQVIGKIVDWNCEQGFFCVQIKNGERKKIFVYEINDLMIK